jgi:tetratricopeptide (TPR) repeat protein
MLRWATMLTESIMDVRAYTHDSACRACIFVAYLTVSEAMVVFGSAVLFGYIGAEWARSLDGQETDGPVDGDVERMLAASPDDYVAMAGKFGFSITRSEGPLLGRARSIILSGGGRKERQRIERIGRLLVIATHLSERGGAEGHFLVGHALWRRERDESARHFRLARRAYEDLGVPLSIALSGLAAVAVGCDPRDEKVPENLQRAFSELATVDAECSGRLAPAVDHDLAVYRVARELIGGGPVPVTLPGPVTEDDLSDLRLAMVHAVDDPERAVSIARWIQSFGGEPESNTEELDVLAALLADLRKWEALAYVLQDMIAHGDQRLPTIFSLAQALRETGRWPQARELLTARVQDGPESERIEILQFLVISGTLAGDLDVGRWRAELRRAGGTPPEAMAPPTMAAAEAPPELLADFRDGTLRIDPRATEGGQGAVTAHLLAAMVRGLGVEKGRELLADIAAKDPELYPAVIGLLSPGTRPRSAAEEAGERAEQLFRQGQYRAAITEYQAAISLDPESHLSHLYLGDAHFMLGEHHIAMAHFAESITIRPTAQAHRFTGDAIQKSKGNLRRAQRCYEDALALDPAYKGARQALEDMRRRLAADDSDGDHGE